MTLSRNLFASCLVLLTLVLAVVATPWFPTASGQSDGQSCSDYVYREDAQLGFQDGEACPELPSRTTALTCADFASQADAQAYFEQDPYSYRNLTDYGRGIGDDGTIACPELLAGTEPTVEPGVTEVPVDQPTAAVAPADAEQATEAVATETVAAEEIVGSDAAIYAGSCATDTFSDPVAELSDVAAPTGTEVGAPGSSAVESSFSEISVSLGDIVAEDHVLVVFDESDPDVALACGPIGGVTAADGSLAIGLREYADSGYSGVAYLQPSDSGTGVTIFLAEDLAETDSPAGTPVAS